MKRPWLAPLVPLYAAGIALSDWRRASRPQRLRGSVISIGNLSVGGTGKTPLTMALARLLGNRGIHVDVLSRGYGRRSALPLRVDPGGSAKDFGDEPLLIAKAGVTVYVAAERYQAGALAESDRTGPAAPAVHLLDDGFQHRQLHRDVDILLLDRDDLRDSLLPAGNLREAVPAAARADAIVIPAGDPGLESELRARGLRCPIWNLRRQMAVPPVSGAVMAFCGIARPGQFFDGLEAAGVQIAARQVFRDHYDYTDQVVEWLVEQSRASCAAALVTTEKDLIRLGDLARWFPPELPLLTAQLTVRIDNETEAVEWLLARLPSSRSQASV